MAVILIGTLDTKGVEIQFVRDLLRNGGLATRPRRLGRLPQRHGNTCLITPISSTIEAVLFTKTARVIRCVPIHAQTPEIESHLEGVDAAVDRQIVDELPSGAQIEIRD